MPNLRKSFDDVCYLLNYLQLMNYTIFYSWQSDLENRLNRSFIEDALKKAVIRISKNPNYSLEAVVDRDTYGLPGSPSIVESITGKIAKSDFFICDISIINKDSEGRPTPNPNVLYELGFASAILGWERIIMVQNIAYGGVEKLPFDLRGRRVLQYQLDETIIDKAGEKQKLRKKLEDIFHDALQYYGNFYNTKDKVVWWGKWEMESKVKARGGQLQISRVSSDAFFFHIRIYDGARTGDISGKALILTPHSGYSRIKTEENKYCEITFRRRLEGDSWIIDVEQGMNCSYFHGMNTSFSGIYKHSSEPLINYGYLDEIDLIEIERLTGKYLSVFLDNFQQISFNHDDYGNELKVISAGVKGFYSIMQSIVVLDKFGSIWCACLDPESYAVRYYTNTINGTMRPKEIDEWLSNFSEREQITNNIDNPL